MLCHEDRQGQVGSKCTQEMCTVLLSLLESGTVRQCCFVLGIALCCRTLLNASISYHIIIIHSSHFGAPACVHGVKLLP